jgi:hypothetical protein
VIFDAEKITYATTLEGLSEVRKQIINRFYPLAKAQEWGSAIMKAISTNVAPLPQAAPVAVAVTTPVQAVPVAAPVQADQ